MTVCCRVVGACRRPRSPTIEPASTAVGEQDNAVGLEAKEVVPAVRRAPRHEPAVSEAAIAQQGDAAGRRQEGEGNLQHREVPLKRDAVAAGVERAPTQRERPSAPADRHPAEHRRAVRTRPVDDQQDVFACPASQGGSDERSVVGRHVHVRIVQPPQQASELARGFAGPAMIVNHWLNNGLPQISSAVTAHANVRSRRMSSRGFPWRTTFTILECALRLAELSGGPGCHAAVSNVRGGACVVLDGDSRAEPGDPSA